MTLFFLCTKIFFARILDVSIGTVRTLYMVKGKNYVASILAFLEVMIWFYVARSALSMDVFNLFVAISYSGGFAIGTFIGTLIAKCLIHNKVCVFVFSKNLSKRNLSYIRSFGFGVSAIKLVDCYKSGFNRLLIGEIDMRSFSLFKRAVNEIDESAFIIVNESKYLYNGFIK